MGTGPDHDILILGTSSFSIDRATAIKLGKSREVRANLSHKELRWKVLFGHPKLDQDSCCFGFEKLYICIFWKSTTREEGGKEATETGEGGVLYLGSTRITSIFLVDRSLT